MRLAGHITSIAEINTYRIPFGKLEWKKPLGDI
jgi:hypothetical protein